MAISVFRTEILTHRTKSSFAMNEDSIDLKADKQMFLGNLCHTDIDVIQAKSVQNLFDHKEFLYA